jgi:hypothetical protein
MLEVTRLADLDQVRRDERIAVERSQPGQATRELGEKSSLPKAKEQSNSPTESHQSKPSPRHREVINFEYLPTGELHLNRAAAGHLVDRRE